MTLDQAIPIVSDIIYYEYSASRTDKGDAIQLLLEAGLAITYIRKGTPHLNLSCLPSETPY